MKPLTLSQLISSHRARNGIKPPSARRRTPLSRRMQARSIKRKSARRG